MRRFSPLACLFAIALVAAPAAWAEDSQAIEELRALRAALEKQAKQIDALTEQVAKLRIALEKAGEVPLAASAPTPAIPTAPPPPPPAEAPAPPPAVPEFQPDPPKAEAADGKRHVVVKGETLTSIAKHYNIPLFDLKKANKNVDERKLQIGQTLTIPTARTAETPEKKDENP